MLSVAMTQPSVVVAPAAQEAVGDRGAVVSYTLTPMNTGD
jgi:hypothetical protein